MKSDSTQCANISTNTENNKNMDLCIEDQSSKTLSDQGLSSTSSISIECLQSNSDSCEVILIESPKSTEISTINTHQENIVKDCDVDEPQRKKLCRDNINQLHAMETSDFGVSTSSLFHDSSEVIADSSMFSNSSELTAEEGVTRESKCKSQGDGELIGPVLPPHLQKQQARDISGVCPHIR